MGQDMLHGVTIIKNNSFVRENIMTKTLDCLNKNQSQFFHM
jgi:hypothetical protein